MKLIDIAVACISITKVFGSENLHSDSHEDKEFEDNVHYLHYLQRFGISFDTVEEIEFRKAIYLQNDAKIEKHNKEHADEAGY